MQIWAESGKSALPICNYSQILYQFLAFTQNLKRSHLVYLDGDDYIKYGGRFIMRKRFFLLLYVLSCFLQ